MCYCQNSDEGDNALVDPFCDPKNPQKISIEKVALAYILIRDGIVKTTCDKAHLSAISGMNIYLKQEFKQFTGSFKERGARFTLLQMNEETRKKGVFSASAGNHAQAMCYHGYQLGVPITVVMPVIAPLVKIQKCKQMKGNVIIQGQNIDESKAYAMKLAKDQGATYVNGFDHPDIVAGQGSVAIEILEQVPDVDAIVIPVGGAGLIAGMSVAIKALKPSVKVIGVESECCPSFSTALKNGGAIFTETRPSLADGLAVPTVGYNSYLTAKDFVDKMILVKEGDIAVAILRLVELEKFVIEGAGATGVAAVLSGQLDEFYGKNVVIVLSGGNMDSTILNRVIDRGLAADSRLVKVFATIPDRTQALADLFTLIGNAGAVIKHVNQERAWLKLDVFSVETKVVCETRDFDHVKELEKIMKKKYKNARVEHVEFPAASSVKQKFRPDFK